MSADRSAPDWDKLCALADICEKEYQEPGWNVERWRQLRKEVAAATNGNPEFTEFMSAFAPRGYES